MTPSSGVIICVAYILGLLFAAVPWGSYTLLGVGIAIALIIPRYWRWRSRRLAVSPLKSRVWLIAGIVGCLAAGYFQIRLPHPAAHDISQAISDSKTSEQIFTVEGTVSTLPRLTNSNRAQFWLEPNRLNEVNGKNNQPTNSSSQVVEGKLYVTAPILQATGLYPQTLVAVTGKLYKTKPTSNPGGFDFQYHLQQTGTFAGLSANQVTLLNQNQNVPWGWWKITQRITQSQVKGLGTPEGLLVSSIVLGSKAVDLPNDIKEKFIQVGLAHALAASGFQVSLILGFILALTRKLPVKTQVILGTLALFIFVGLAGLQPAVLRAAIMGWAALVSLMVRRKTKPLGLLLLAATILLVINPLWIWDLGFQLSFLATCGLVVTVNPLVKKLDWLPNAIASLVAVPIAAAIWTLPLQLQSFGIVAPYSIATNIITTPFISLITIVGVVSGLLGAFIPALGSMLAGIIYYPTNWLIKIVDFFTWLPGNSLALGKTSLWQLLLIYVLIIIVSLNKWWQKRLIIATSIVLLILMLPLWQSRISQLRVIALANISPPILVIQEQGKTTLINSGDADTVKFTLLPFLRQQGINKIDTAIAQQSQSRLTQGWLKLSRSLTIENFYTVGEQQPLNYQQKELESAIKKTQGNYQVLIPKKEILIGSTQIELLKDNPKILQLQIGGKTWLSLGNLKLETQKELTPELSSGQVIYWSGEALREDLIKRLRPQVAIASSNTIDPDTLKYLQANGTQVYLTGRDGAVEWTPKGEFDTTLETGDKNSLVL
ncbi:ComEC/Rec2 family competence protein [Merismopedia glauca]|uniref:Competence protein n=1 Tax=Merismopedia glauca CCAP 1448/3 TaxID=1296344 RepID=A0A2T1C8K5_9CYAN|nr:ComEC/Rec2 family competence protein [Merismopedia glauca]PSB04586.1 competence protein [Merismopedia glauca CCAP 1448/3]